MSKEFEKPLVTVSGKKSLFKLSLHHRLIQDLPQEGVEWRRRLDSNSKSVYIDVEFVDFDVDNVERTSERLLRLSVDQKSAKENLKSKSEIKKSSEQTDQKSGQTEATNMREHDENVADEENSTTQPPTEYHDITIDQEIDDQNNDDKLTETISERPTSPTSSSSSSPPSKDKQQQEEKHQCDMSSAFFNRKLLGSPTLHTYWADKADFEAENQKSQFDEWIGRVQASTCTEWAIIIIEDGDFKAQLGTALFKSKLQSSASQTNVSSSSLSSMSHSSASFLDRMKKGLSTMFQNDTNSDRWLTLVNQDRVSDNKAQDSYANFVKRFRNLIVVSFSKQLELFEEQLRVQREMRVDKNWSFSSYFSLQEELAFAFEFLTLFEDALLQYDFLDALFTDYISSLRNGGVAQNQEELADNTEQQWMTFNYWPGLCLDMNCGHSENLRKRIVNKQASLLDFRNYLFAKKVSLILLLNQPWRVAASTSAFLQNCIREHHLLNIDVFPGALTCWSFISSLEVLQKCECYSCTSTMENYSLHTVDIWNNARMKLIELGLLCNRVPDAKFTKENIDHVKRLLEGLGPDPHNGLSYQKNDISPQARLRDSLASGEQFSKHLIEISELTLGTYKHIGRKRHALLVGKELADFYASQCNFSKALNFLVDLERLLLAENWQILLVDVRAKISKCNMALAKSDTTVNAQTSEIAV